MKVTEVKKQIQKRRLDPFYVFTGDEIEAQQIYIRKISEVTGKPIRRIEKVSDAFESRGLLLKSSFVFVCRDDMDFWKSAVPLEDLVHSLDYNILILEMSSIDGRGKSAKNYTTQIVQFDYMDADTLFKYTAQEVQLADGNIFDLIEMCENDYGRILSEADKIRRYAQGQGITEDTAFTELVAQGTICRPQRDTLFPFTDAMLRAEIDKAFSLLAECQDPPLRVISVLYSNFKRVLQYQVSDSRGNICEESGLSAYDVKLAKDNAGHWNSRDLVDFLKTLQRLEQGIKTGEIDEDNALDLIMVMLL